MEVNKYLGNFGDINPFEHGGMFVFNVDNSEEDERDSFIVIEVVNMQDADYTCSNPYATKVYWHRIEKDQIEDNLINIAMGCGWAVEDLYINKKVNWELCASQMVILGLIDIYDEQNFSKFTELANYLFDEFPFDNFREDIRFYLEMEDEMEDAIETYFEDFIDGALDMIVEIAGFPEIDRESLLEQITDENFILFDEILYLVEFEDLMFIANKLRGGFRTFGSDFMAAIFKHEIRGNYFNPSQYGPVGKRLAEIAEGFETRQIEAVEVDYDYQITLTIA
jgi:hypothetical protein